MGHYECRECGNYLGYGHEEWCPNHTNEFDLKIRDLRSNRKDEIVKELDKVIQRVRPQIEADWDASNPQFTLEIELLKQKSLEYKENVK